MDLETSARHDSDSLAKGQKYSKLEKLLKKQMRTSQDGLNEIGSNGKERFRDESSPDGRREMEQRTSVGGIEYDRRVNNSSPYKKESRSVSYEDNFSRYRSSPTKELYRSGQGDSQDKGESVDDNRYTSSKITDNFYQENGHRESKAKSSEADDRHYYRDYAGSSRYEGGSRDERSYGDFGKFDHDRLEGKEADRYEARTDRYEARADRYEARADRYETKVMDKYATDKDYRKDVDVRTRSHEAKSSSLVYQAGRHSMDHLEDYRSSRTDTTNRESRDARAPVSRQYENGYLSDSGHCSNSAMQKKDREHYVSDSGQRRNRDHYGSDSEYRSSSYSRYENDRQSDQYEKRDYRSHDRPPPIRAPLITTRTEFETRSRSSYHEETSPVDIESTIQALKRQVADREREIDGLKTRSSNDSKGQSEDVGSTDTEVSRRIDELIREKENMATEIWKLQKDLDLKPVKTETAVKTSTSVTAESSGPPDMEKELSRLRQENESLRNSRSSRRLLDLEEENRTLRAKLTSSGEARLRDELARLGDELRDLRSKNHQLLQDNIKLTEHLRRLEEQGGGGEGLDELRARCERYRKEREAALDEVEILRSQLRKQRVHGSHQSLDSSAGREGSYGYEKRDVSKRSSKERSELSDPKQYSRHERRSSVSSDHSDSTAVLTRAPPNGLDPHFRSRSRESEGQAKASAKPPSGVGKWVKMTSTKSQNISTKPPVEDVVDSDTDVKPNRRTSSRNSERVEQRKDLAEECYHTNGMSSKQSQYRQVFTSKADKTTNNQNKLDIENETWLGDEFSDVEESASQVGLVGQPQMPVMRKERSGSVDSDATDLILGNIESMLKSVMNQDDSGDSGRAKEPRIKQVQNADKKQEVTSEEESGSYSFGYDDAIEASSSLRSVNPRPIVTQHNKHILCPEADSTPQPQRPSSSVKRAFCPRNPADLTIGDMVKFSRQGGKISRGEVKYIGHLPGKSDTYLGVELEMEMGKHDGMYGNYRYFQCKPNKGVFVAFSKVVMAWGQ